MASFDAAAESLSASHPIMKRLPLSLLLALGSATLLLVSCGAPDSDPLPEPLVLELGSEASQGLLTSGWSKPQGNGKSQETWVWAVGRHARIDLDLDDLRYGELHLEAIAQRHQNAPTQTLRVTVNGERLGEVDLEKRFKTFVFPIPDGLLRSRDNRIDLSFRYAESPRELGISNDARTLAAAFKTLTFTAPQETTGDGSAAAPSQASAPEETEIRFHLGGVTRTAVDMREPWRGSFVVQEGDRFELAFGSTCGKSSCDGTWTFRAQISSEGESQELLTATLSEATESWRVERPSLDAWAGQKVEIQLSVEQEQAGDLRGIWGRPMLVRAPDEPPMNIVLISVDTLRADHLGSYGYTRPTSPNLDDLAASGTRFSQAISQAPWTTPSHMTMMTSQYPSSHHVNGSFTDLMAFQQGKAGYRPLPESAVTVAEVLRDNGYMTMALTSGVTMTGELGFAQGFRIYEEGPTELEQEVESRVEELLDAYGELPFFFFFHTFEVHAPYTRSQFATPLMTDEERRAFEAFNAGPKGSSLKDQQDFLKESGLLRRDITVALYDGGIQFTDAYLGRFFEELRRRGLDERTLIIVTSDHGEEFGDHHPARLYNAHCNTVYDELIHVPFIVRAPAEYADRAAGRVVDQPIELVDLAPTLLDFAGLPVPEPMLGQSLKGLILGEDQEDPKAWTVSEATCQGPEIKALRTRERKYIAEFEVEKGASRTGIPGERLQEKVFDLRRDPKEQRNLNRGDRQLKELERWRRQLEQHFQDTETAPPDAAAGGSMEVSDELEEKLRALGYIQ